MSLKMRIELQCQNEKGAVLITVTWIVLIASFLAMSALIFALVERKTMLAIERDYQSQLIAESAVEIFMHRLFYDQEEQVFRSGTLEVLGHSVNIDVIYEKGKINLNRAGRELLSAMFASKGVEGSMALSLADRILDWRDTDDVARTGGDEKEDYEAAGLSFGPRNGPFESVGELRHVLGMSQDIYSCVFPSITVYSQNQNVDWEFSDVPTLGVLRWAYLRDWQEAGWPDPDALETRQSLLGARSDLGGQSLTLHISFDENGGRSTKRYSMVLRYKSISNRSGYGILKPLKPFADVDSSCASSV